MRFFTWNTQGDFTEASKLKIIEQFFDDGCDVGFLQEGGTTGTKSYPKFVAVAGLGVGAKNERCTNYVLVSRKVWDSAASSDQIELFKTVHGGGEAARTPAAAKIGSVMLVAWHSISAQDNSDTGGLIDHCLKIFGLDAKTELKHIIIGGDFNSSPKDITELLGRREKRAQGISMECMYGDDATHPSSDKNLDFFVCMSRKSIDYVEYPQAKGVKPSDHNPVVMETDMEM